MAITISSTPATINTATILEHATITIDPANAYLLAQKADGTTGKISVFALMVASGVPVYSNIATVEAATITATFIGLDEDANGERGFFKLTQDSATADGVEYIEDSAGTLFKRWRAT